MEERKQKKYLTQQEALEKLQRYCAYQDRCHQEVRSKLLELGVYGHDLEDVMAALIEENFLNEERFARSYARGKFRFKSWGKLRITQELKKRKISAYLIRKALEEIPEEDYLPELYNFLEKKNALLRDEDLFARKKRLAAYGIRRGFESEKVWKVVNDLIN